MKLILKDMIEYTFLMVNKSSCLCVDSVHSSVVKCCSFVVDFVLIVIQVPSTIKQIRTDAKFNIKSKSVNPIILHILYYFFHMCSSMPQDL